MRLVASDAIREAARRLAEANVEAEPALHAVYLFPSEREIRLIELDPNALPSERITPFYFGPDPHGGIAFPSAIVLLRPEEIHLTPPEGWGTWDDAVLLWPDDAPSRNGDRG